MTEAYIAPRQTGQIAGLRRSCDARRIIAALQRSVTIVSGGGPHRPLLQCTDDRQRSRLPSVHRNLSTASPFVDAIILHLPL
jgi:hypothetical protein